mgnify:CR=1 FL=1|tara:strand:- start:2021 stop:2245 length:225 start_codon:yes stop_codon:yes gene_type:complete
MKLHQETVATYTINEQRIDVDLCWKGDNPEQDGDKFYDLYDKEGTHLNEGDPWHDDGDGVPTIELITEYIKEEE